VLPHSKASLGPDRTRLICFVNYECMKSSCKQKRKNNTSTSSELSHLAVQTGIDGDIATLCSHLYIGISYICLFLLFFFVSPLPAYIGISSCSGMLAYLLPLILRILVFFSVAFYFCRFFLSFSILHILLYYL
jgi:hypothetical protein